MYPGINGQIVPVEFYQSKASIVLGGLLCIFQKHVLMLTSIKKLEPILQRYAI